MPNVQFGIDHPVVTVRDLARVRAQFERLGFAPNPIGFHPWGTTLSLLMFKDNFIELISVDDPSKFGTNAVNGFCYGRNVGKFLERAEGLGLVALHSKDGYADHRMLVDRGLKSQGQIDFRRDMTKPDGTPDVAVVSLGLFLNDEQPDVSNFICHQHRPELIWVPQWQQHPNGVTAVTAVTYLANNPLDLVERYVAIFGSHKVKASSCLVEADTGCGVIRIATLDEILRRFGSVELPDWGADERPHGVALSVASANYSSLPKIWESSGVTWNQSPREALLVGPDQCGNVIMEFERSASE